LSHVKTTPRTEWALIGGGQQISANKIILVWNKKTQHVEEAVILHSETDSRGDLYTEDAGQKLDWRDYCHWCYRAAPTASSADKGLWVYARRDGEAWVKVFEGEPHETNQAAAVEAALSAVGLETVRLKTGHPPSDRKEVL
jgi:hypothetical protein